MFTISADQPDMEARIGGTTHGTRKLLPNGQFRYTGSSPVPTSSQRGGRVEEQTEEDKKIGNIERYGLDKHYAKFKNSVPADLVLPNPITEFAAIRLILRHSREFNLHINVEESKTEIRFTALTDEQKKLRSA